MNMQYLKIGDLCNVSSSKRIFARQYVDDGIPFYRQKEIIDKKNNVALEDPIFIASSVYNEFEEKFGVPQKGDLLITAVGATLGIPYVVGDEKFYFKDGNLIWLSGFKKELNSTFLYYWIDSSFGTQTLWNRTIGSAQPALTIDSIKKLSIPIPDRNVQDRIATTLKTYDELIENNNKRIKTLEQMAENLYKEWFVRFRFPNHENTEFENGIPKGWEVVSLNQYVNITYGFPFNSDNFTTECDVNPVVRIRDVLSGETKTYTAELCNEIYSIHEKDILIGMDGIFHMNIWKRKGDKLNQRVAKVSSKFDYISNMFIYYAIFPQIKELEKIIQGTTVAHLSAKDMKKMKILLPTKELLERSAKFFDIQLNEIINLWQANQNLTKQRDLLLPRLMSGKLEVLPTNETVKEDETPKILSFEEFVSTAGFAARAKSISEASLRKMYEVYVNNAKKRN